jgi:transcriptional regulator with GAF, ATPase, and Fis domain
MAADDTSELLLDTFVELADTLASGYEVGDLLQFLVDRCSELLLADTAGVLLETPGGDLPTLAAATSQDMLHIEDLEIGLQQGPCLEAFHTGEQVLVEDLGRCHERWPEFTPRIVALGMRSAYAFPLRLRGDRIGALNLYRAEVKAFAPHEVRLGQALADIAAVGILQGRAVFAAERRAEQLQRALDSRIMIEQAKGILAERRRIPPGEAFERLRLHARSNNMKLREVCRQVMNGELDL